MYITAENLLQALKTDVKTVCIEGRFMEPMNGYRIIFELKKNSAFDTHLTKISPPFGNVTVTFPTVEKAAFYLIESCGYQGPVVISNESEGIFETRKIDSFLSA